MVKKLSLFIVVASFAFGDNARDIKMGENIVTMMCDKSKLTMLKSKSALDILKSKACTNLTPSNASKVSLYLNSKASSTSIPLKPIVVAKSSKCPVCGMFVEKYPKWVASITLNGKSIYFDGSKDMMKYLLLKNDFKYDRAKISTIQVTDFYTLESINAKSAFFVIGSDVYGPMGHELIPFKTLLSATNFMKAHNGKKIVSFAQITQALVLSLDD